MMQNDNNNLDGRILSFKKQLGNGNCCEKLIAEAAQNFNVTPLYLQQLFKKQTGKTVKQFDKELRLEKAKNLLETTYLRAKEICHNTGFTDYSHFTRDFTKQYGISPKELQRRSWIKLKPEGKT